MVNDIFCVSTLLCVDIVKRVDVIYAGNGTISVSARNLWELLIEPCR